MFFIARLRQVGDMSMEGESRHVNGTLVQQLHFRAKVQYRNRQESPWQAAPGRSVQPPQGSSPLRRRPRMRAAQRHREAPRKTQSPRRRVSSLLGFDPSGRRTQGKRYRLQQAPIR
jgi:hypothetical protein